MVKKCCIVGCKLQKNGSSVKYHRLPITNRPLLQSWIKICGLSSSLSDNELKNKRVCSKHFRSEDYTTPLPGSLQCYLFPNIIPSLLIPQPCRLPTHEIILPLTSTPSIYNVIVNSQVQLKVSLIAEEKSIQRNVVVARLVSSNTSSISATENLTVSSKSCNGHCQTELRRLASCTKGLRLKLKDLQSKKSKSVKSKNIWRTLYKNLLSRKKVEVGSLHKKIQNLKDKMQDNSNKDETALRKIFTTKQMKMIKTGQRQAKYTNEEIAKGITIRYKSNAYEYLRSVGFPFPSTRTLQRFTNAISFHPGILYSVINLIKQQFEHASEISRQVVVSFDEMSIQSNIVYDPEEDKIYGPKANMNVFFVRGLFEPFKQPFAYDFDEKFTAEKFMHMVEILETAGLKVRANVNDLGGKNRGIWKKLGISVNKEKQANEDQYIVSSSLLNPVSNENIYFFADTPHLIKLLRNNALNHGITLEGGYRIRKSDFEKLLKADVGDLKSNFKVSEYHLNVQGREKMRVLPAVQLFSKSTAEVWKLVYPNRSNEANFIELVNDFFDLMNSRNPKESQNTKKPFGLDFSRQLDTLERMNRAILTLRVGTSQTLYPFQRGFLISIKSMRDLFNDMSGSSMRIGYILTHRLNQDIAENAFCMIRSTGEYNDNPDPVDAKRRLKLLMLSWGHLVSQHASVISEDVAPYLTGSMLGQLIDSSSEKCGTSASVDIGDDEMDANVLSEENYEEVLMSMGIVQRLEEGGHEYVAGFVASKFKKEHPELSASHSEIEIVKSHSWVHALNNGGLTIPSLKWRNDCRILDEEFQNFHRKGDQYNINKRPGVLKGLCAALEKKYPDILPKPLFKFLKTRLFVRIKVVNKALQSEKREKAAIRAKRIRLAQEAKDLDTSSESEYEEEEKNFEYLNEFERHLREEQAEVDTVLY